MCAMEQVLGVYTRPYDAAHPVICMDETTSSSRARCVRRCRRSLDTQPATMPNTSATGWVICTIYYAPFDDWRRTDVATDHTASTWAEGVRRLVEEDFPQAQRITLVLDNLSTHSGASLYKSFPPAKARALLDKLELVYTPKHGSWLNMAELEFSVLARQCLRSSTRLPTCEALRLAASHRPSNATATKPSRGGLPIPTRLSPPGKARVPSCINLKPREQRLTHLV